MEDSVLTILNEPPTPLTPLIIFFIKKNESLIQKNFKKNWTPFTKKFKRKGKYTIPCTIKGIHGSNDYIINFPLKISGLKPNKDYIANYLLLVECNINIWKEILNNLLKNI